jgi:hypothetical protein
MLKPVQRRRQMQAVSTVMLASYMVMIYIGSQELVGIYGTIQVLIDGAAVIL